MYPELWIILNKFGKYISYFGNLKNTSHVFHNLDFFGKIRGSEYVIPFPFLIIFSHLYEDDDHDGKDDFEDDYNCLPPMIMMI